MKRLLGALTLATTLLLIAPGQVFAADLCGSDPNCTVDDSGFGTDGFASDGTGIPGWFVALFIIVFLVGIGATVYRVGAARDMARRAGLDEGEAATVALLDNDGLSAAYMASQLRPRPTAPQGAPPAERSTADRLGELQALRHSGAITEEEWAARRQAIIDTI